MKTVLGFVLHYGWLHTLIVKDDLAGGRYTRSTLISGRKNPAESLRDARTAGRKWLRGALPIPISTVTDHVQSVPCHGVRTFPPAAALRLFHSGTSHSVLSVHRAFPLLSCFRPPSIHVAFLPSIQ